MTGIIDLKSLSQAAFSSDKEPVQAPQENSKGSWVGSMYRGENPSTTTMGNTIKPSVNPAKPRQNHDEWLEELMDLHNERAAAKLQTKPKVQSRPDLRVVPATPQDPENTQEALPATTTPTPAEKSKAATLFQTPDRRQAEQVLAKYRISEHNGSKLFIHVDKKEEKIAFSVSGDSIRSAEEDSATAAGMVAAAVMNGWNPITSSGSPAFQSQIFLHACRMGVVIDGFTPSSDDLALLRKEQVPLPRWVTLQNEVKPAQPKQASTPGL